MEQEYPYYVKNKDASIHIFVGIGLYEPWKSILLEGQEKTWLRQVRPPGVKIVHVHAKTLSHFFLNLDRFHEKLRFKSRVIGTLVYAFDFLLSLPFLTYIPKWKKSDFVATLDPVIQIGVPDSYLFMKWKQLGAMRYFLEETQSDFLVMTTTSSYLNLRNLHKLILDMPRFGTFYGAKPFSGANFISGSFRVLSRDVVHILVENRTLWNAALLEDVAMSRVLRAKNIIPTFVDICNIENENDLSGLNQVTLNKKSHFRLKSGTLQNRNDVLLMHLLHSKLDLESERFNR